MLKKLLAAVLCVCMLASCGGSKTSAPSEPSIPTDEQGRVALPMDFSIKEQTDVEFGFQSIPDSIYTMLYEPVAGANTQIGMGLCIPDGYESDWVSDTDTVSSYWIYEPETEKSIATVTVQTAPSDIKEFYGVDTDEEAVAMMQPEYFPAEVFHKGLRTDIVDGFGYELVIDWFGKAYGLPMGYLEFIDPETKTHSMRMCLTTESIDGNFYSFTVRADVPDDDEQAIYDVRAILFSMHPLSVYTESAGEINVN